MIPKSLNQDQWEKIKKRFKTLNLRIWESLDGMKKIGLMKNVKLEINAVPIFGKDFRLEYPDDIYNYPFSKKFILDLRTLNRIQKLALYEDKEVGGTIVYDGDYPKIDLIFQGDQNRISLDFQSDTHTLFHTHPDIDRKYDPPSVLDVLSYLSIVIKYLADLILDLERGVEHPVDDPLVIQSSMVFTKDEVYVYYISHPLVVSIMEVLMDLYLEKEDFVYEVEKLLEEMEIAYSNYLWRYNTDLTESELEEYLKTLSSLGIIIKRFGYLQKPEVYITI